MTVSELIDKLQRIAFKEQEVFVSINDNDGLDIVDVEEGAFAVFINVHDEEEKRRNKNGKEK
jgi:hypothetical protein